MVGKELLENALPSGFGWHMLSERVVNDLPTDEPSLPSLERNVPLLIISDNWVWG